MVPEYTEKINSYNLFYKYLKQENHGFLCDQNVNN